MSESDETAKIEVFYETAGQLIDIRSPEGKLLFKCCPEPGNLRVSVVQKRTQYDVRFNGRRYECKMRRRNRNHHKS